MTDIEYTIGLSIQT